jgi:adenosylcobyric acid synthase
VLGYEIRHGRIRRLGGEPLFSGDGLDEGCRVGAVFGTSWHGVMESDAFRQNFLRFVAGERGLDWTPGEESFAAAREARLEKLGDLISDNVDREALLRLIEDGPPSGMPVVSGQQTAIGDASRAKAPPSVTGEVSPPIPTAFSVPGNGEQRSES